MLANMFSCFWSSLSVLGLVVVSALQVDRMGVVLGREEEEPVNISGFEARSVLIVTFVSKDGQVEQFRVAWLVEDDFAGTWLQGEEEVVGTGQMLLLLSLITGRVEGGVNILEEEVVLKEGGVWLILVVLCWEFKGMQVVSLDLSQEAAKMESGIKGWHVELHKLTGKVLVETLLDFLLEGFFFNRFLFSVLRMLISAFILVMLSDWLSFFC